MIYCSVKVEFFCIFIRYFQFIWGITVHTLSPHSKITDPSPPAGLHSVLEAVLHGSTLSSLSFHMHLEDVYCPSHRQQTVTCVQSSQRHQIQTLETAAAELHIRVWVWRLCHLEWEADPSGPWIPISAEAPWSWVDWKTRDDEKTPKSVYITRVNKQHL